MTTEQESKRGSAEMEALYQARESIFEDRERKLRPAYDRLGMAVMGLYATALRHHFSPFDDKLFHEEERAAAEYREALLETDRINHRRDEEQRALDTVLRNRMVALADAIRIVEDIVNAPDAATASLAMGRAQSWWAEYQSLRESWKEEEDLARDAQRLTDELQPGEGDAAR